MGPIERQELPRTLDNASPQRMLKAKSQHEEAATIRQS